VTALFSRPVEPGNLNHGGQQDYSNACYQHQIGEADRAYEAGLRLRLG
jgi:hypothetical protein